MALQLKISLEPPVQFSVFLCFLNTEQILLKNHLERLTFLTKKGTTVDEKDAHAKLGDNVSFKLLSACMLSSLFTPTLKVTLSYASSSNSPMQRDECIKHALQAPGITTTNPKVAVTDNFLCTGGLTPFRDHIACNGMFPLLHAFYILKHE